MSSDPSISAAQPPNMDDIPARDEASHGQTSARDTILALLEGSDNEDEGSESWNLKLTALPSSSQEEHEKDAGRATFDIDLEDEMLPAAPLFISSPAAETTTQANDDDDGSAAYARLMKSVFSKSKPKSPPSADDVVEQDEAAALEEQREESEEDMPISKVKLRTATRSSPVRSLSPQLLQDARSPSVGLFVSPTRSRRASPSPQSSTRDDSDSDEMPSTIGNARLKALVASKRAERKAKEKAEQEKAKEARKQEAQKQKNLAKQFKEIYSSEMDDGMTEDAQKSLTESSRPTQRKASKKALEEMNRETQRMARNQQLTHQARVKRKFTTLDFVNALSLPAPASADHPKNHGTLLSSDTEANVTKETPPSSPPSLGGSEKKVRPAIQQTATDDEYIIRTGPTADMNDEELPDLDKILSDPILRVEKGKEKDIAPSPSRKSRAAYQDSKKVRAQFKFALPPPTDDSDDDLEIVSKKPSRFAIFDKLPEKKAHESASLLNLRALSHLSPPSKNQRHGRQSMTQAQLRMKLAEEMQRQMVAEKQERMEIMKARGYVFKTEEEIEEDQLFIENQLEKARKDAMELARKEGEAAKQNGEEIDENYVLPSDDESDGGEVEEEEEEEMDVEISGSEEEDEGEQQDDEGAEPTGLFDEAAEEADDDDDEEEEDAEDEAGDEGGHGGIVMDDADPADEEAVVLLTKARSKPRNRHVVLDDDDDADDLDKKNENDPEEPPTPTAAVPTQSQSSPFNAFGFALPNADLGLTQMFQGTMADLATQQENGQATPAGNSLDFLRDAPVSTLPTMSPAIPSAGLLVESSQPTMSTPAKQLHRPLAATTQFTPQFPTPGAVGSQISPTKLSEIPEPTQDAGFESFRASTAEGPFSTVDTVMIPVSESPVMLKKGKLRRRAQQIAQLSDDEVAGSDEEHDSRGGEFELTTNAFDALFKAAKKPASVDTFDKKRSEAKGMVEDQAEESEDEYAGLGGASDDESDNGVDEEMQQMIDEGPVDVKEAELARFFADKDKAEDEKRIDKLYRDITTGALRRKRGVGIDELSDDSDDEAAERRKRKQMEFQKMRKAMMEDENISKIADNPKKLAFLKAIEDREEFEEIDYLGDTETFQSIAESQPEVTEDEQQASEVAEEISATSMAANIGLKRKLPGEFIASTIGKETVAPNIAQRRRVGADDGSLSKRPVGIAEIRESLSFLIDEPLVPDSQASDGSDDDGEDNEAEEGPVRRTREHRNDGNGSAILASVRASVINRLTVSRQNSMSVDEESQASGPMAFHTSNSTGNSGFKIPSLLRRATTNLSNSSSSSSGTTTPTNENAVRMGGSKKSNIHFQAREAERMKKVREAERRRTEGIRKSVVGKGRMSVLGNSLGGRNIGFE